MDIKELGEMLMAWRSEGATLQWRESDADEWEKISDEWIITRIIEVTYSNFQMRIKPKTIITLLAREIPAPETVAPPKGTTYYMPVPHFWLMQSDWRCSWRDSTEEQEFLKRGLVYLKKEDAIAAAKAMLPFGDDK